MLMQIRALFDLCKRAFASWSNDYAPSMGAALAYYTVFSIAPLLLIVISVAGLVFGQEAARGEIFAPALGADGRQGAVAVQGMLQACTSRSRASWPR
jgi:membrane protein